MSKYACGITISDKLENAITQYRNDVKLNNADFLRKALESYLLNEGYLSSNDITPQKDKDVIKLVADHSKNDDLMKIELILNKHQADSFIKLCNNKCLDAGRLLGLFMKLLVEEKRNFLNLIEPM